MKRIIVTGATGFIGANLVRRLLAEGHNVSILYSRNSDFWRIKDLCPHVYPYEVDFLDRERLFGVVKSIRPEWIFHLAAYGVYSWHKDCLRMMQTNIISTVNLIEACLDSNFEVFVNTGTSSEYGFKNHAPSEKESLEPESCYAVTKVSATLFCRHISRLHRIHIHTLRLYSVYGPYEEPRRLIPTLVLYGLNGQLPKLVQPDIARDFVYIEDVEKAYVLAAAQPNQEFGAIYNVGTGIQTTICQAVDVAIHLMDIKVKPQWGTMQQRDWDTNIWVADSTLIQRELSWRASYSFEEGLKKTIEWFRCNPTVLSYYQERLARDRDSQ